MLFYSLFLAIFGISLSIVVAEKGCGQKDCFQLNSLIRTDSENRIIKPHLSLFNPNPLPRLSQFNPKLLKVSDRIPLLKFPYPRYLIDLKKKHRIRVKVPSKHFKKHFKHSKGRTSYNKNPTLIRKYQKVGPNSSYLTNIRRQHNRDKINR